MRMEEYLTKPQYIQSNIDAPHTEGWIWGRIWVERGERKVEGTPNEGNLTVI